MSRRGRELGCETRKGDKHHRRVGERLRWVDRLGLKPRAKCDTEDETRDVGGWEDSKLIDRSKGFLRFNRRVCDRARRTR